MKLNESRSEPSDLEEVYDEYEIAAIVIPFNSL
jgi:hypothetical protein